MQGDYSAFTRQRTFIGVVEDRNDPNQLGRVRVRVFSVHNDDKTQIPTRDLPWAMVLQPGSNPATTAGWKIIPKAIGVIITNSPGAIISFNEALVDTLMHRS